MTPDIDKLYQMVGRKQYTLEVYAPEREFLIRTLHQVSTGQLDPKRIQVDLASGAVSIIPEPLQPAPPGASPEA